MSALYNQELAELDNLSVKAANALRSAMQQSGLEGYKKFLDTMYHYTKHSQAHLSNAAKAAQTPELQTYFEHMVKEEKGHYLLALKDLEGYGETASAQDPATVVAINTLWNNLASSNHGNGYLGIVYVFENIAQHVGKDIKELLTRLDVTKKQSRWFLVHSEADIGHGGEAKKMVEKYIGDNPELLLKNARKACELWIALMTEAFDTSKPRTKAA